MTPDLATGNPSHTRFKALHAGFLKLNITSVQCVVLSKKQAAIWIKRKHYKGMGGAGVVAWNAVATARSDATEGRYTRWMTALAYLEKHGIDAEDIRDNISSKTTTIERVLASTYITAVLGLIFGKDGSLVPDNGDEEAAVALVKALLEAMSERSFVETLVSSSDQQLGFINRFASMSVKKPTASPTAGAASSGSGAFGPAPSGYSASGSSSSSFSSANPNSGAPGPGGGSGTKNAATASTGVGGTSIRSIPVKTRKVLAEKGLRISNQPLNKFYSELRKLNVEKNPFISAAIIRVFLEKSSTIFLESMQIPPLSTKKDASWQDFEVKLRNKIEAVLKSIDPSGSNPKLAYARDIANGVRDKLHTTDHLNQAIHSHDALPSYTEIVTLWDRLHPYFFELFETIEKNRKP